MKHQVNIPQERLSSVGDPTLFGTGSRGTGELGVEGTHQHHDHGLAHGERIHKFYKEIAVPAESFARAVAFAMSQPEKVDVNEILFRPTRQEL